MRRWYSGSIRPSQILQLVSSKEFYSWSPKEHLFFEELELPQHKCCEDWNKVAARVQFPHGASLWLKPERRAVLR